MLNSLLLWESGAVWAAADVGKEEMGSNLEL
jgi:hypothetical protein